MWGFRIEGVGSKTSSLGFRGWDCSGFLGFQGFGLGHGCPNMEDHQKGAVGDLMSDKEIQGIHVTDWGVC